MQRFLTLFFVFFIIFGFLASTAEAARFGGGRSFGMQRSMGNFSRYQQSSRALPAQTAPRNRWIAPLAGLAMGGLLASLFMSNGLGTGLLTWLAVLGVIGLLWNLIKSKSATMQNNQRSLHNNNMVDMQSYAANSTTFTHQPIGFEPETFLRDAKVQFIRLQAAYDTKDLNDLCEFTAPEVFGEIQMQLQERGDAVNRTEVVSLDAELLDSSKESNSLVATVKFSGMIKESVDAPAAFFTEIWHFRKNTLGNKWIVAGVQQA